MENITINKGMIDRLRGRNYYNSIIKLMEEDKRLCYLTCDGLTEGSAIRAMRDKHPYRVIDVGIAEQNLIGVSAGLALGGKIPFVESLSSFLTLRAMDQIHADIAINNLRVRLLGTNNGTSGGSGPTHDAICDIAMMNAIPNMSIIAIADMEFFWQVLKSTIEMEQPIYFRMPRYEDELVYSSNNCHFSFGGSNILRDGKDVTIITAGKCVNNALKAAELLKKFNVDVGVVDMYSIKPLDKNTIIAQAKKTGKILSVEDHNTQGGLGTLVAATIAEAGLACQIYKLGINDEFAQYGPREDIANYYKIDVSGITEIILERFV